VRRPVTRPVHAAGDMAAQAEPPGWLRREMGRELAGKRQQAGLTQEEFAALTGRDGRSTVSHAETGEGDTSREFWVITDRLLGTDGFFASCHDLIGEYLQPGKRAAIARNGSGELRCHPALKSADPRTALAGYRRLGWPVGKTGGRLVLVTGTAADVLEVSRTAGAVAAAWWQETGGTENVARGLPALPVPGSSLAVIDTGERWYFLVAAGGFPWESSDLCGTGPAAGPVAVRWHAAGSSIPVPPSQTGKAAARWACLPVSVLRPAPPLAVLDLLGRAAAMTSAPGTLKLPGGALAAPALPQP
jgi:hypothetical protein